ncbi:MAG TPA: cytochrome c biogenesis CcdA family protein [Stellaceae bacterium]|nr:cytochrome c biogenesis CcdA family protein [Stellaceae bacterium]
MAQDQPSRLYNAGPRLGIITVLVLIAAIAGMIAWGPLGLTFENVVSLWQNKVAARLHGPGAVQGWRLYPIAFLGGLIASISPCILGMLPVNLSYIGASKLASRTAALRVASSFVLGVIIVNVALGLVSSLFFALFVQYRAPTNIGVGALTVLMGLWLAGILRLPTPQIVTRVPPGGGSVIVGIIFALVASPCASPILIFILGAVSLAGSPVRAVSAMTLYAIGYTLILFLASFFAGVAVASRRVLAHSELVSRIAAATLIVIGIGTFAYGVGQL